MRLGLGTVQFGLDYGVSNKDGKTASGEAARVLAAAREGGIATLDTAAAYGDSETVLGGLLKPGHGFEIVTKLMPPPTGEVLTPEMARDSLAASRSRLGQESVHGLMVHHARDLLAPEGKALFTEMERMRGEGLTKKIGVSVYEGEEIDELLSRYDIGIMQVPVSVFDQRLLSSGRLERLAEKGVEVHVRSIFLQGLALMDPAEAPAHFGPVLDVLETWSGLLEAMEMTAVQGALAFARSLPVDVVLVGVNTADQLRANLEDFASVEGVGGDLGDFAIDDPLYVNPANWKLEG